MPATRIQVFQKYEYTVTCRENEDRKISAVRHYGAILNGEILKKLYSNLSYAPIPTGDYFLIDQHEIERWQENETKCENDVMNFEIFADLYMETFYVRLMPVGGPGEQRILADEVLRVIPAVLKKQGTGVDQALLQKYRDTWSAPDNFYRTISLDELNEVLDEFHIDKNRITAVPDIAFFVSQDEMPKKCTRPVQTFDISGNEIFSAAQARLFIFQTFIVKLNHVEWRKECPKNIEADLIKLLKSYQEMKRANLVSYKYMDAVQFEEFFDRVCEDCALACFEDPSYTFPDKSPEDELPVEDYQEACTRMKLPIHAHTWPDTIPVWIARIYMIGGWLQVCCLQDDDVLREMLAREAGDCMVPEKMKEDGQLKAFLNYIILNTEKAKIQFKSFIKKEKKANKNMIDKEAINRKKEIMENLKAIWIPIVRPEYPYLEKKMNDGSFELTCDILSGRTPEDKSESELLRRTSQVTLNDDKFRENFLDLDEEQQSVVLFGIIMEQKEKVGSMLDAYRRKYLNGEASEAEEEVQEAQIPESNEPERPMGLQENQEIPQKEESSLEATDTSERTSNSMRPMLETYRRKYLNGEGIQEALEPGESTLEDPDVHNSDQPSQSTSPEASSHLSTSAEIPGNQDNRNLSSDSTSRDVTTPDDQETSQRADKVMGNLPLICANTPSSQTITNLQTSTTESLKLGQDSSNDVPDNSEMSIGSTHCEERSSLLNDPAKDTGNPESQKIDDVMGNLPQVCPGIPEHPTPKSKDSEAGKRLNLQKKLSPDILAPGTSEDLITRIEDPKVPKSSTPSSENPKSNAAKSLDLQKKLSPDVTKLKTPKNPNSKPTNSKIKKQSKKSQDGPHKDAPTPIKTKKPSKNFRDGPHKDAPTPIKNKVPSKKFQDGPHKDAPTPIKTKEPSKKFQDGPHMDAPTPIKTKKPSKNFQDGPPRDAPAPIKTKKPSKNFQDGPHRDAPTPIKTEKPSKKFQDGPHKDAPTPIKTEKPTPSLPPVCPKCVTSDQLYSEAEEKLKSAQILLEKCEAKNNKTDRLVSMMKEKEEEVKRLKQVERKNQEDLKKKDKEMEKVKSKLAQKVENLTKQQLSTAQLAKKEIGELKDEVKRQKTKNTKLEQSLKAELAELRRQLQVMEALNRKYEESMVKLIRDKYESQTPSTSDSS